MNANILGREANDQPKNPMMNMAKIGTPLAKSSPDMRSPDTLAEKRGSFFQPGDAAINADTAGGPKDDVTLPGGNSGIPGVSPSLTNSMQFSRESGNDYSGKDTQGRVIHSAKTSTGNIYENQ